MIYEYSALNQAIYELRSMQFYLSRIKNEPEITNALKLIKEATDKLAEVEKAVSNHLEEHR